MFFEFKFPDVGEGITEGEIVEWKVKEGDFVKLDQVVLLMETAKAIVELPSPVEGKILKTKFKVGETVKVGQTLVEIEAKESIGKEKIEQAVKETVSGIKENRFETRQTFEKIQTQKQLIEEKIALGENFHKVEQSVLATPATRKLARDLGIDLNLIKGTGTAGRITDLDLKNFAEKQKGKRFEAQPFAVKSTELEGRIPLKGMKKTIAEKMVKSFYTIPHANAMDECIVSELWDLREKEKVKAQEQGIHLTFLPFIFKAVEIALKKNPFLNASLDDSSNEIVLKKYYNIGFAVDTNDGLMVPVIKGVDKKSILEIGFEIQTLSELCRNRKILLEELQDSTFSITNFGSLGGTFGMPIINYPNAAILGIGRIEDKAVVIERNGKKEIVAKKVLPLSLSFDHRIIDGAMAVKFLSDVKKHLEDPGFLLIDSV